MSNFFLSNDAINLNNYTDFISGMSEINSVIKSELNATDNFTKHYSVWQLPIITTKLFTVKGHSEIVIISMIAQLKDSTNLYMSHQAYDADFPNECNAFLGIDFKPTAIIIARQIINSPACVAFKNQCVTLQAFTSLPNFWKNRLFLFPHLVFCDRVWNQIAHLSITDDRFKLIKDKLKILNDFTGTWKNGPFEFKNLGLENSPDTTKRVKETLQFRTFDCPNIGNQTFSLHAKWYFGSEPFRLYYFPNAGDHKVYIGYIGPKDEIGF